MGTPESPFPDERPCEDGTCGGSSPSSYARIPRIIWMLWFDGWERAPELHRRCLETWQLYNPSWEVRPVSRRDFPGLLGKYLSRYDQLRVAMNPIEKFGGFWIPPAAESDLLRLVLLSAYGGCWVDSTMLCRRPLDNWLPEAAASGFFAFSPESHEEQLPVMSSFLASAPDHPLTVTWLQRVTDHWVTPTSRRVELGFFWVHKIFGRMVNSTKTEDAAASVAWEAVPRVTGEYGVKGPHFWVKYNDTLRPPPTDEYRDIIQGDAETPMWKLTNHEVKLHDVDKSSCYWVLLEETRRQVRTYAAEASSRKDDATQVAFSPGMSVCLRGLEARPELNGIFGVLVAFNEDSGRWQVRLDNGGPAKLLKEQNLAPCPKALSIGPELAAFALGSDASAVERLLEYNSDVGCH